MTPLPPGTEEGLGASAGGSIVEGRFVPGTRIPYLKVATIEAFAVFMIQLKIFFNYMKNSKRMLEKDIVNYIQATCFEEHATYLWIQSVVFEGTWEDLYAKLVARFIQPADRRRLGETLMYKIYQNAHSIREYGAKFEQAIAACRLAEYPFTDDVLLASYRRGLNDGFQKVLAITTQDFSSWRECEAYLNKAEADGVDTFFGGKPRGGYNKNNRYTPRDQGGGRDTINNVNGINGYNNYSNDGNASYGGRGYGSSSSSYGRGPAGGGRGAGRGGGEHGDGRRECHACGSHYHLKARCDATQTQKDAYRRSKQQRS
jgi:hypothetical protein